MIPEVVLKLRSFFISGKTKSLSFRHQQLSLLKHAIIEEETMLIDALQQDLGKPPFESYLSEIHLILQEINLALHELHNWTRPERITTPLTHFPMTSLLMPEPRGIILIIGPWNYPLQLLLIPLIGAIAAGNCALLKPSEHAPHSAQALTKLIAKIFPPEYITVIEGSPTTVQTLLQQKLDYIFFTGSNRVGKIIMQAAAQQLTPLTLELGGKSPCIVTQTANVDCAAKRIVWGKFYNAGQNCISPDYLLVAHNIKTNLVEKLKFWITKFYGKDPSQSTDYARIINDNHFDRLQRLLSDGNVIIGGTVDKHKRYIAPTLMQNINVNAPLMQEEIFGPILPIIPYNSLDQAIDFINQRPHPLALYIFSSSKKEQNLVLNRTQSGGTCINDTLMHAASPYLPFGGIGESGFGSYHGKKTFAIFTHYKAIIHNSCQFDTNLRYPPYGKKHGWLRKILHFFS